MDSVLAEDVRAGVGCDPVPGILLAQLFAISSATDAASSSGRIWFSRIAAFCCEQAVDRKPFYIFRDSINP